MKHKQVRLTPQEHAFIRAMRSQHIRPEQAAAYIADMFRQQQFSIDQKHNPEVYKLLGIKARMWRLAVTKIMKLEAEALKAPQERI